MVQEPSFLTLALHDGAQAQIEIGGGERKFVARSFK